MSLYQCEKCGCCENTALGHYWGEDTRLCSECYSGVWHDSFKKIMLPKSMFVTNKDGDLSHKETGDTDFMKYALNHDAGDLQE